MKWEGSVEFGYDINPVEFDNAQREEYAREKNLWKHPSQQIKASDLPATAKTHEIAVNAAIRLWYGDRMRDVQLPYKINSTRQNSWGGKFIGTLDKIVKYRRELGEKLKADKDSWLSNIKIVGPNFTIAGSESLSEAKGENKPLHEANIEFSALVGLEGKFDMTDAALNFLQNMPNPAVALVGHGLEYGRAGLESGAAFNKDWNVGVKASIKLYIIVTLTAGSRSSGNSDGDSMAVFSKPPGGEWGFKEGSLALEFTFELKTEIKAQVGYFTTVGYYAIEGGGVTKLSVQLKVMTDADGKRVIKFFFYFNGLKLWYQISVEHRSDKEGSHKDGKKRGQVTQAIEGSSEIVSEPKQKTKREEIPLIDPFHLPKDPLPVFTFG